ncbi:gag/pol protein [Cucumis melo var. makuwa]|uniref:Gag/pol protein n=1 Tax=Cucumis melo var. makuwa TaxID=1194695 RepID=A0A5D3E6W6_CUCMM|nr:gag/pol protein [Cucumis melo var. makuwa]
MTVVDGLVRPEGITRLICASLGITRLICASLGITRLIGVSFGITRLIRASFGITRLMCKGTARGRSTRGRKDAWRPYGRVCLVRKVGSSHKVSLGLLVKSVNFESRQIQVQKSVVHWLHAIFRSKVAGSPEGGVTKTQVVIPDDSVEDSLSYKQAMNDVDKDQWVKTMDLEIEPMYFNSVWELVDLPKGVKPIACRWIYKRKRDSAGKEQKVCKLNQSIYGLEQASRSWNIIFDTAIKSYGFDQYDDEPSVYKKINKGKVAFLVLYVDDILLIGNDVGYLTEVKTWLAAQFQMKDLEKVQYVLGIQIIRDRKNKTLALSQAIYIDKMLVRYSMQNSEKDLLPFRHGVHLSKEQCAKTPQEVEDMRRIPYASVVGSLMYVMLCTRPDICYAVGIVSRYQSNQGLDHWTVVKIILKYLRRTRDYMLMYAAKDLILTGYADSDFQTDKDSRKSTSGSVFTLNGGAVVWRSIKQGCIADSTIEAGYVAACEATKEAVWLRKFLQDLKVVSNMNLLITLYCD